MSVAHAAPAPGPTCGRKDQCRRLGLAARQPTDLLGRSQVRGRASLAESETGKQRPIAPDSTPESIPTDRGFARTHPRIVGARLDIAQSHPAAPAPSPNLAPVVQSRKQISPQNAEFILRRFLERPLVVRRICFQKGMFFLLGGK